MPTPQQMRAHMSEQLGEREEALCDLVGGVRRMCDNRYLHPTVREDLVELLQQVCHNLPMMEKSSLFSYLYPDEHNPC